MARLRFSPAELDLLARAMQLMLGDALWEMQGSGRKAKRANDERIRMRHLIAKVKRLAAEKERT